MGEIGRRVEGMISWDLGWRRSFSVHEEHVVSGFFLVLQEFQFSEESDMWVWRHTNEGLSYVASSY